MRNRDSGFDDNLEAQELSDLEFKELFIKARDKAFKLLSYRARSAKEITERLLDERYPSEIIAKVMELLIRYDYINDLNFARDYAESRMSLRGYGELRVRHELYQKGIGKDIINQVFSSLDYDAVEIAASLLNKRLRGETDADYAEKNRAYGFLARRGYSNAVINQAFKRYFGYSEDYT